MSQVVCQKRLGVSCMKLLRFPQDGRQTNAWEDSSPGANLMQLLHHCPVSFLSTMSCIEIFLKHGCQSTKLPSEIVSSLVFLLLMGNLKSSTSALIGHRGHRSRLLGLYMNAGIYSKLPVYSLHSGLSVVTFLVFLGFAYKIDDCFKDISRAVSACRERETPSRVAKAICSKLRRLLL